MKNAWSDMDVVGALLYVGEFDTSGAHQQVLKHVKDRYESGISLFIDDLTPGVRRRLLRFSDSIWTLLSAYLDGQALSSEQRNTLSSEIKIVKRLLVFSSRKQLQQEQQRVMERKNDIVTRIVWAHVLLILYIVMAAGFFLVRYVRTRRMLRRLNLPRTVARDSIADTLTALSQSHAELARSVSDMEKQLARESHIRNRYHSILNELTVGIIIEGRDGSAAFVNRIFRIWFDLAEEITGDPVAGILTRTGLERIDDRKMRSGEHIYEVERKSGNGTVFHIFHDISDLENMSSRLVNSERMVAVGEMASKITHEIRNPLNTIKVNSEYLSENISEMTSDDVTDFLRLIVTEVGRLEETTGTYMDMIRFNRKKKEVAKKTVFPKDLELFLSFYRQELEKRSVTLRMNTVDTAKLTVSLSSFREITLNLFKNAWEELGTGEGGTICIGGTLTGDMYNIVIEDSGGGIPDSEKEAVFEIYYTNKPGGTGIGLSNTVKRVHEVGGEITLSDSSLGGARFTLSLPVSGRS